MQKFYWNNQQSPYSERYRTYQVTRDDWCQDFSTLTLAVNPPDSQHACCVQVVNNEQEIQDTRGPYLTDELRHIRHRIHVD